jgi:YVTN family beta-propeller protein
VRHVKQNKKLYSVTFTSVILVLFLILISSTTSAATEQGSSSAGTYAYITNYDGTVSVIDTATNTVTATIPVGGDLYGVAVNPKGTKVYVGNKMDSTVSVIDTMTNTVTATVPVGLCPFGVAVNPAGTKVYSSHPYDDAVSVIDTATNTVTSTIHVGKHPWGVAVTPDGTKVYVTNFWGDTVSVIDTATNTVTATIPVGDLTGPYGVAVNPKGTKVYVANCEEETVSVIDTATNTVTATVPVDYPSGVAVNPKGTKVYVTNNYPVNTVSVIDTATNTVTATIPVGSYPEGVAVNPDGTKVYVANSASNTVSVIDTATNNVTATVPVGNNPYAFGQFIASNPVPLANFSAKPTEGKAPLNVAFTDESKVAPTKWKWNFGDGKTSTLQNPTHKYSKVGSYTVKLTATNDRGSTTVTKKDYIKVVTKPIASFSAKPTSGKAPLTVAFTDKSTGVPTKWKWSFGDGKTSTVQNPKHQYLQEGKYKVTLTVSNVAGGNTVTKTNYITVTTNTRPGIYSESE